METDVSIVQLAKRLLYMAHAYTNGYYTESGRLPAGYRRVPAAARALTADADTCGRADTRGQKSEPKVITSPHVDVDRR